MKSAVVAYLLWCLVCFGFAGIHRFCAGKWISGLIWLFTDLPAPMRAQAASHVFGSQAFAAIGIEGGGSWA